MIVRPRILFAFEHPALVVYGVDGGKAPAISRKLDEAASPETAIKAVWEAIASAVPIFAGGKWFVVNPAHVLYVDCEQYD